MKNSIFKSIISVVLTVSMLFSFSALFSVSAVNQTGTVVKDYVNIRTSATTKQGVKNILKDVLSDNDNKYVMLNTGHDVTILETVNSPDETELVIWYHVEFTYKAKKLDGYIYSEFVKLNNFSENVEMPEGVPDIYKPYIEQLLANHPNWNFVFYDTGYEWDELFSTTDKGQGFVERSLLQNPPLSRRSTASGNYNWRTDEWISHDAGGWYQANSDTIAYYMDPRNFLTESKVFMFETLEYESSYQLVKGVEGLLKDSFMSGVSITNQDKKSVTYAQAYMDAAEYSKVSPYHLASRTIQEVGYNGSGSTSGKYSGYEGYYNFYNIGAYAGTTPIANALNFAKNGGSLTTTQKSKYLLPWNSQYKAIVGGASWLGTGYIYSVHKQNTLYFQKFNTSNPNYAFYHQYMQNIAAPSSEASTIKKSYDTIGITDASITFIIPYYRNMPAEACKLPASSNASPNNWLSSLKINDYNFGFDAGKTSGYEIEVGGAVSSIKISATTVNSKAKVAGVGAVALKEGNNEINIVVTAENGDKRTYTINIVRNIENKIPLKSISLDKTDISMFNGDSTTLKVSFNPSTTTDDTTVKWTSSNTKVATVSSAGKITAVGEGTATITAKVGNFTATCKVTVSNKIVKGDVDADGDVTIADALMIFKHKSSEITLSKTAQKAADTDGNGYVELADALRIFKFKSGEIDKL